MTLKVITLGLAERQVASTVLETVKEAKLDTARKVRTLRRDLKPGDKFTHIHRRGGHVGERPQYSYRQWR